MSVDCMGGGGGGRVECEDFVKGAQRYEYF